MTFGWYEVKAGTYDLEYDTSYATLRLLVVGSSCTEKVTKSYCSDISEISYPVIGQPSWCYIGTFGQALADGYDPSRDEVSGYLKALWTHHEEFLNCAFRTPTGKIRQRSNYAQHNNPAIYEYALSVVDGKIWFPTSQDELNEERIAVNPAVDQSLKDSA
jgi:hypothetical protein